jgi:hypothetical protein
MPESKMLNPKDLPSISWKGLKQVTESKQRVHRIITAGDLFDIDVDDCGVYGHDDDIIDDFDFGDN